MSAWRDPLRLGATLAIAGFFYCFAYASAVAPSGEPVRRGLRGLRRARALATNQLWRGLEPVARWLGRRMRGWIPEGWTYAYDRKLELAGDYLGMVAEELFGLTALVAAGGAGLGFLLGRLSGLAGWATLGGLLYGVAAPSMLVSNAAAARLKAISRRLPYAIDLLSLAVGAGQDLPGAIRQVIDKSGDPSEPLIEELSLILQNLGLGQTRQQALSELARRAPCDGVVEFVGAMVQAEARGTPVAEVLRIQAGVARLGRSNLAEEVAAKAGVKLMLPLAIIFLCVLALVVSPIVLKVTSNS